MAETNTQPEPQSEPTSEQHMESHAEAGLPAQPDAESASAAAPDAQPSTEGRPPAEATPGAPKPKSTMRSFTVALPRSKGKLFLLAVAAMAAALVFAMAVIWLFNFSESTTFCTACHVMHPEGQAHNTSPHQRVDCGTCHVGPGVVAAVNAKLQSVRYLWVYPLNLYARPVPSPAKSLRPARVVCEQCHWPQKTYSDRFEIIPNYASNEASSLSYTQLVLQPGGGAAQLGLGRGIHWHIENQVEYIATDEQLQNIPWVQATYNGVTTQYLSTDSTLTPEQIAKAKKHTVDCIDCHNRATHAFTNPSDALDTAMNTGNIPADLPYIKREGSNVLMQTYATEQDARVAIQGVADFYKNSYPDLYAARKADVDQAVNGLQVIFDNTQAPYMNLTWQTHPNNIGHEYFPGCFRCHDGKHLSADNHAIRLECNLCHTIPQVTGPGQPLLPALAPTANPQEPQSHHATTWLAEHRYHFDATCANCHTVDNPGGADNSSFCSNSACHGTQWKYIGLNAPRIRELSAPPTVPSKGAPPEIPHPVAARTDCLLCHGKGKVIPYPENHTSFTVDTCQACHKSVATDVGPAPTPKPAATAAPTTAPAAPTAAPAAPTVAPTAAPAAPTSAPTARPTTAPAAPTATLAAAPTAAAAAGEPPPILHSLVGRDNCLMCHDPQTGIRPAPANHAGRTVDTCQMCHKPSS